MKGNYLQSVHDYIAAKQRDRPHWQPLSDGNSSDADKVSDEQTAIASLFAQNESSGKHMQPISGSAMMTDEQVAIAALFG